MEGTVWKVYHKEHHQLSLEYICELILHNFNVGEAKELLFSARDCLGVSNWEGLQHAFAPIGEGDGYFKYPTPPDM